MKDVRRRDSFRRALAAAAAAALLAATTAGCAGDEGAGDDAPADVEGSGSDGNQGSDDDLAYDGAYDEELASNLADHKDQRVAITGEVSQAISPDAFTIGRGGPQELLVISREGEQDLQEGTSVRIIGKVQVGLDLVLLEEDLGRDLDDQTYSEWDRQPYVVAEEVETSPAGS